MGAFLLTNQNPDFSDLDFSDFVNKWNGRAAMVRLRT